MTVISVTDISLSFGVRRILERVSFALNENDKLGVVGVNGCGKSTLFRVILGEAEPDEGKVFIAGDKTVGILRQDGAFTVDESEGDSALSQMISAFPELVADEVRLLELEEEMKENGTPAQAAEYALLHEKFAREGGLEFRGRCAGVLMKMGFDEESMHRPLSTLSGGQRTRLALARQLAREPDVLLLDEPTNHLDIETLTWLENFLIQYKKCVLVISHDRWFLDRVTNKTLALEYGRAKVYSGGYTATMAARKTDRELAEKHYRDQQKELARQEKYIAQQRAWNRERNIVAAESRLKLLAKQEKLERPREAPRSIRLSFTSSVPSGNDVLSARRLSMAYGQKQLFTGLDFLLKRGERMFVLGPNGCGKSTLVKIVLGQIAPTSGRVEAGYNVEIGYYDQENQNLTPENTVLDELWNAYPDKTETEIRNTLASFRFVGEDVTRTVGVLSGGERARLTLAKLILSRMNLLVLDEPTNHLDIGSREALEEALERYEGTVFIVSHDRYFIEKLATRVLALGQTPKDLRVSHVGHGYEEYLESQRTGEENVSLPRTEEISETKADYLARKQSAADARRAAARAERMKKEAADLEAELGKIEAELAGDAAADYVRAAELDARRTAAEERLLAIYEEIGV